MPTLKESTINASFFPGAGGSHDHLETVADKALVAGRSDLVDGDATPTTVPSTRRSSFTAVGDTPEKKGGDKIIILHFERGDPEDPLNWSKGRKWVITSLLCMMTVLIGLSTSAYSNTINGMSEEFHVANVVGQVGMFTFNFACAVAPLFLAPLCELIGRREVYLSAYGCFVLCFLFLALGTNIWTEIIGRFFSGVFGSCGTILVGGTLADIWRTKDRGLPMSVFTFCAIFGTIAAPTYCGYIDAVIGWRWIEWVHMIANGVLFVLQIFFLKETRGAKILAGRAKQLRAETGNQHIKSSSELESESIKDLLKKSSTRAVSLMVHEPVLFMFGFWIAMAWGITFLFLSVIPLTFQGNHGWSEGNSGLPYLALILGCFFGFGTGFITDAKYNKVREANGGVPIPEYRLWGSMFFAILLPIGLFIFSFTQYKFIHWIAPMISLVCIILGIYHIFLAVYNYTADAYGELASSAIAGQSFMRNSFAASFPLFATFMFKGMKYQYAGLLLSLFTLACAPLPYVLFKWGATIRARSQYAVDEVELEADEEMVEGEPQPQLKSTKEAAANKEAVV